MTEIHLAHLSWGSDAVDDRNRFHETALREARTATEYRGQVDNRRACGPRPPASRLRPAGSSSATTDCNCPA